MKTLLFALVISCFTITADAQTKQDTGKAKQNNPPANNKQESSPVINRIAVSDQGMPAEKNTTTNKRSTNDKPAERKKKNKKTTSTPK